MRTHLLSLNSPTELAKWAAVVVGLALAIAAGRWIHVATQPLSADSAAHLLMENGRADDATHLFVDSTWRAIAMYRAGRYNNAIAAFAEDQSIDAIYNIGNAYAQLGRYPLAIDIYERVLAEQPDHDDALFNLELVRRADALTQQEQASVSGDAGDPGDDSIAVQSDEPGDEGRSDDIMQTVSSEPKNSDDEQQTANGEDEQSQTQSSSASKDNGSGTKSDSESQAAVAQSQSATDDRNQADTVPDDAPPVAFDIDQAESERALAEEILLRHIRDEPRVVLRARLRMALERQLQATNQ